jgi:hypothetical protein
MKRHGSENDDDTLLCLSFLLLPCLTYSAVSARLLCCCCMYPKPVRPCQRSHSKFDTFPCIENTIENRMNVFIARLMSTYCNLIRRYTTVQYSTVQYSTVPLDSMVALSSQATKNAPIQYNLDVLVNFSSNQLS